MNISPTSGAFESGLLLMNRAELLLHQGVARVSAAPSSGGSLDLILARRMNEAAKELMRQADLMSRGALDFYV